MAKRGGKVFWKISANFHQSPVNTCLAAPRMCKKVLNYMYVLAVVLPCFPMLLIYNMISPHAHVYFDVFHYCCECALLFGSAASLFGQVGLREEGGEGKEGPLVVVMCTQTVW